MALLFDTLSLNAAPIATISGIKPAEVSREGDTGLPRWQPTIRYVGIKEMQIDEADPSANVIHDRSATFSFRLEKKCSKYSSISGVG